MNQQERYELLTKLSEFYVKDVKPNLKYFNKAKFISYTSIIIFRVLSLTAILMVLMTPICLLNKKFIIVQFIISVFFVIFLLLSFCMSAIIKRMDKENDFQILKICRINNLLAPIVSIDNEIKKRIMQNFLQVFGDFYWCKIADSLEVQPKKFLIERLNILKNPIKNFDDYISGSYKDVKLTMMDGDTSLFNNSCIKNILVFAGCVIALTSFSTLLLVIGYFIIFVTLVFLFVYVHTTSKQFKGLIVEIDMNKNFEGHTFILEKNNFKGIITVDRAKYQEINLEDVEFLNEYNVYSENQIEARYLLTTAFMERIKNIKTIFKAEYVRVSFKDKKIVLLIHTGRDMFNLASFLSAIGEKTFVQCFEEICSVLDLVEELKLNEKLGL